MRDKEHILIFGASARAAAFSALRANLHPWCADLFADRDLEERCPVVRVPAHKYPRQFMELCRQSVPGPWMYTGGLENRRKLVKRLSRIRCLWGNDDSSLRLCRSPWSVASLLLEHNLPHPRLRDLAGAGLEGGPWLVKPVAGAGGTGIRLLAEGDTPKTIRRATYCQEFIEGESYSAVYVGDTRQARFVGVTRQLVGEVWLHAGRFQYCGSIGPVEMGQSTPAALARIGNALASGCRLRGLFGIDFILKGEIPYTIEVNPRYTASVEVLEHALGWRSLAEHGQAFGGETIAPAPNLSRASASVVGKAILFAREGIVFPKDGPWLAALEGRISVQDLPPFADIPQAGERIERGRPILTFFARAPSLAACSACLRQIAGDLDHWLFER